MNFWIINFSLICWATLLNNRLYEPHKTYLSGSTILLHQGGPRKPQTLLSLLSRGWNPLLGPCSDLHLLPFQWQTYVNKIKVLLVFMFQICDTFQFVNILYAEYLHFNFRRLLSSVCRLQTPREIVMRDGVTKRVLWPKLRFGQNCVPAKRAAGMVWAIFVYSFWIVFSLIRKKGSISDTFCFPHA